MDYGQSSGEMDRNIIAEVYVCASCNGKVPTSGKTLMHVSGG